MTGLTQNPPATDRVSALRAVLAQAAATAGRDPAPPAVLLRRLVVDHGLGDLPSPGAGDTRARWRALSDAATHDLSFAKLFEGHTDALAIMREVGALQDPGGCNDRSDAPRAELPPHGSTWGVWAAEPPTAKVTLVPRADGRVDLHGRKAWCSGADTLSHALLTAWSADGKGPFLVAVALRQPGVAVDPTGWVAVGMAGSASLDVAFDGAVGERIGGAGAYLSRPGFWQGSIGIAACWYGGALALAHVLRASVARRGVGADGVGDGAGASSNMAGGNNGEAAVIGCVALGRVDAALQGSAALLRDAARWIDANPAADAAALALRTRLNVEATVRTVLEEVGRTLGATPFCRDPHFARIAADLPVYVRQSHGDQDFAALGRQVAALPTEPWGL